MEGEIFFFEKCKYWHVFSTKVQPINDWSFEIFDVINHNPLIYKLNAIDKILFEDTFSESNLIRLLEQKESI